MPYAGSVYSLPPGTTATTLALIDSSDYNAFTADIAAAQNAARPVVAGGTGAQTVIGGWDNLAKKGTDIATASSVNLTTATGPSLSFTGTTTVTGVTLAEGSIRIVRANAAFSITASASLLCNGSASVNMSVSAEDTLIFRGGAGGVVSVVKLGTAYASDAQALGATSTAVGITPANLAQERTLAAMGVGLINGTIVTSTSGGARTIAIKTLAGADPSATDPVTIAFRDVGATTAGYTFLKLTAATSLVISSGSTMGFTSAAPGRLWIVGFNDAGTFRLGAVNALSGTSIMALRDGIRSSTAEGGAGAADSAQVIYTGTAVTSKAMRLLGYIDVTETTAGTWATTPTAMVLMGPGVPRPGDTIQVQRTDTGAMNTGTNAIPIDDTIPQSGEGDQFISQAITPLSAANLLRGHAQTVLSNSAGALIETAIFRDSATDALTAVVSNPSAAAGAIGVVANEFVVQAGSISATTFKLRGGSNGGTTTFNGTGGARRYGGVLNSYMEVQEIMA